MFHKLKQWFGNNLWYGENSRAWNRAQYLQGLSFDQRRDLMWSVMPDGSKVWGIDISHWNLPPVDLKRMVELYGLKFVIIKGCDGSLNTRYYPEHVAAAKLAGVPWGTYVWLYPNSKVSMDAQVNAWHARASSDPPPMGVFIDAEWTSYGGGPANPSAADLRSAHDKYRAKSGKAATTYTAPGYANTYLTGFDWSREELWVAHWGVSNPQLPTGATGYTFHQFTDNLDGHTLDPNGNASLDGNNFHGTLAEFNQRYGVSAPPPPTDVVTPPFVGVTRVSGKRNGWPIELFISDPAKVRYQLLYLSNLETPGSVAARTGAQIVLPAGEWNDRDSSLPSYLKPKDYTVGDGVVRVLRTADAPWSLMIDDTNRQVIDFRNIPGVRQAFSGVHPLIENGVIDPALYDTSKPQNTEGHARFCVGLRADGFQLLLLSQGVYPNQGLRLSESAQILRDHGAVKAFFACGGGDITCRLKGEQIILPENVHNGQHFERALPAVFLIYAEETPMAETFDYYQYTPVKTDSTDSGNRAIRNGPGATYPRIASNSDFFFNTFARGKAESGDRVVLDAVTAPLVQGLAGDVWVRLYENNGKALAGWTALKHKGKTQITEQFVPVLPPPPTVSPVEGASMDFDLTAKTMTITRRRTDGTSNVDTDPIV